LFAPGETGKLGTRISVISEENAHRNNLAAQYPVDLLLLPPPPPLPLLPPLLLLLLLLL
jgi:hypothetical protein